MQKLILILALSTFTMASWNWGMNYCQSWSCQNSYNECWTPSCGLETYASNRDFFTYYFRNNINDFNLSNSFSKKLYKKMKKARRQRIKNFNKQLKEIRNQRKRLRAFARKQRKLMRKKIRDSIKTMRKKQRKYLKDFNGFSYCDGGSYCHNSQYHYFVAYNGNVAHGHSHGGKMHTHGGSNDNNNHSHGGSSNGSDDEEEEDFEDDEGDEDFEDDDEEDFEDDDEEDFEDDEDDDEEDFEDDDEEDFEDDDEEDEEEDFEDDGGDDEEEEDEDNMVDLMKAYNQGSDVMGLLRNHANHNVGTLSLFLGSYHDDDMRNSFLYHDMNSCGSSCLGNYNNLYIIWTDVFAKLRTYYNRKIVRLDGCGRRRTRLRSAFRNYCSCLLYTSPSPRDGLLSRMPSSA